MPTLLVRQKIDERDAFAEKADGFLSATLRDESGSVVPDTAISSMTLTLFDRTTAAIINSHTATDILNANGGTIDGSGNWALVLAPLDNAIQDATLDRELHVAMIKAVYGASSRTMHHEIEFWVVNFEKVT